MGMVVNVGCYRFRFNRERHVMGKRPNHVKPPAYLSKSPPVPEPEPLDKATGREKDPGDPTRYGDWERKGIAIDF